MVPSPDERTEIPDDQPEDLERQLEIVESAVREERETPPTTRAPVPIAAPANLPTPTAWTKHILSKERVAEELLDLGLRRNLT